jgi:hypothetical protein
MTTLSDWRDRYSRLTDGILQLETLVENSVRNTRGTQELIEAVDKLQAKKGTLEAKQKDSEQSAATFDREFLERKAGFPDPFYPDKLYTIQDFLFFFFFLSYSIFIVALALTAPSATGKILGGGFILLLVLLALIFRYA